MLVKLGTIQSKPKEVTGGAVQGSVLGVLDHNVVLNDLDQGLNKDIYIAKYIDDMTMVDTIPLGTPHTVNSEGTKQLVTLYPTRPEKAFNKICKSAEKRGLKINSQKTQLLTVASAKHDTKARIMDKNGEVIAVSYTHLTLPTIYSV